MSACSSLALAEGCHQARECLAVPCCLGSSRICLFGNLLYCLNQGNAVYKRLVMLLDLLMLPSDMNLDLLKVAIEIGIHLLDACIRCRMELLDIVL
jgi:hypothetical protein